MSQLRKYLSLPYLLQYPTLIVIIVMMIFPTLWTIELSMTNLYLKEGWTSDFIAIDNYVKAFQDPLFYKYMVNSVIWSVGSQVGHFFIGFAFALLMTVSFRGRGFFRGLFFIPWVIPTAVVGVTWRWVLSPDLGMYTNILRDIGLLSGKDVILWLTSDEWTWLSVIYVNWWKAYSFDYVVLLAALQAIPVEIIESSKVDGANIVNRFRYITLPFLKPVITMLWLLGLVWTFINFEVIWLLTQGGPRDYTMTYAPYVYQLSFRFWRFGYAAAVGVIGLIVCLIFAILYIRRYMKD